MSKNFTSLCPWDRSVVFQGSESTPEEIQSSIDKCDRGTKSWRNALLEKRLEIAENFAKYLEAHRSEIAELITREVGKLPSDAEAEVMSSIAKVRLTATAVKTRRSFQIVDDSVPSKVVRYRPLGVVLVLGPFNFPLHLPGAQILPALLAGNTVVFKPSEQSTAVGLWLANALYESGLPKSVFQLIQGAATVAKYAVDSPKIQGVFFTGSRAVGHAVHRQLSGRPNVLLALELGGNNPIVVLGDAPADKVATTVSYSAFISSGQRCTCARRAIFVESDASSSQIQQLVATTQSLRVGLPNTSPQPHLGPLISERSASKLESTYRELLDLGCKPIVPWKVDSSLKNLVYPMIVDANFCSEAQWEAIGELEWFGPLLVIKKAIDIESALTAASKTPYGLAASLLGGSHQDFDRFVDSIGAGVVNWNRPTTGAAGTLPFGGLGDSGNHRPAGFFAIDSCSDPVASLAADTIGDDGW